MSEAPLHSAGLAPFEALYLDLCFGKEDPCSSETAFEGWLSRTNLNRKQKEHLRSIPRARLALYRSLVLDNLVEILESILERTHQLLADKFSKYAREFLMQTPPRSRILREIAHAFAVFLGQQFGPHPVTSLVHYEVRRVQVAAGGHYHGPEPVELNPLRPLIFQPAVQLYRSPYDVMEQLEEKLSFMLIYRDPQHQVKVMRLSESAYGLLSLLMKGEPLAGALEESAKSDGLALDDSYLSGATALLANLGERSILLGGAPETAERS